MARKQRNSKERKPSTISRWWGSMEDDRRRAVKGSFAKVIVALVLVAAVAVGMKALERKVLTSPACPAPDEVRVELAQRPWWMPARLAHKIEASLATGTMRFSEGELTEKIYERAAGNTWVRRVRRVERRTAEGGRVGIIAVDAEFRRPVAKVHIDRVARRYVDAEGVLLPRDEVPKCFVTVPQSGGKPGQQVCHIERGDAQPGMPVREIHYIEIHGVAAPPPEVGRKWEGEDLAAGLRLVMLISTRTYAHEITVVNVENCGGRINSSSPHLFMYAQVGRGRETKILWGRFPIAGGDYVVWPERKMSYLDEWAAMHNGQLAGFRDWLDLRYDDLQHSHF